MTDLENRLAVLRARLSEAADAREKAGDDKRKVRAAEVHHAAAEKALAEAHLEAKRQADEHSDIETRPAARISASAPAAEIRSENKSEEKPEEKTEDPDAKPAPAVQHKRQSLQEMNQSASTQNVRHTAAFTEKQHAQRRNPKRT